MSFATFVIGHALRTMIYFLISGLHRILCTMIIGHAPRTTI